MKVAPIYFLQQLTDEQVQEHSCSDRIWLPRTLFEKFANLMTEPGVFHVIQITNLLGISVVGTPYQPHTNLEHDEREETIYLPPWMYAILEDSPEQVLVERMNPGLLTRMSILPYTSRHIEAEDTEVALRDAFERYGCVQMGTKIPLLLSTGATMDVEIHSTEPQQHIPLCIRAGTIELELLPPLDRPATPPAQRPPTPRPVSPPSLLNEMTNSFLPSDFLGQTQMPLPTLVQPSREETRRRMIEAAMRRLNPNQHS